MGILLNSRINRKVRGKSKISRSITSPVFNISSLKEGFVKLSKEEANKMRPESAYDYLF
jgi:hypothetical protein